MTMVFFQFRTRAPWRGRLGEARLRVFGLRRGGDVALKDYLQLIKAALVQVCKMRR